MSLIKRPNRNNWYYRFQIQGQKHFGSTQTPKKTLAIKVEAKVREDAISRLVLDYLRVPSSRVLIEFAPGLFQAQL
jgi:hypothetical protein